MASSLQTKKRKHEDEPVEQHKQHKSGQLCKLKQGKWNQAIQELSHWYREEETKRQQDSALQTRSRVAEEIRLQNSSGQNIVRTLEDLRKALYSTGIVPFRPQRQLFDLMCVVAIRWIIGDEFESHKPLLLKLFGLDKFFLDVHYQMPRQYGKTTIVGHGVAALALTTPMKITIFSTGKRTSSALMKIIVKAIKNTPGGKERILTCNEEDLKVSTVAIANKGEAQEHLCSYVRALPASGTKSKQLIIMAWKEKQASFGESRWLCEGYARGMAKQNEHSLPLAIHLAHPGAGFLDIELTRAAKWETDVAFGESSQDQIPIEATRLTAVVPTRNTPAARAFDEFKRISSWKPAQALSQKATPWYRKIVDDEAAAASSTSPESKGDPPATPETAFELEDVGTTGHFSSTKELLQAGYDPEEVADTVTDTTERQLALYALTVSEYRDFMKGRRRRWRMIPDNPHPTYLTDTESKIDPGALKQGLAAMTPDILKARQILLDIEMLESPVMKSLITNKDDVRKARLREL